MWPLLLGLLLGADDWFLENRFRVVDHLEMPNHHLFLNDYRELVVIDKRNGIQSFHPIRGDGPDEVEVPLSLVDTPEGAFITGLYSGLLVKEGVRGLSFQKERLPVTGPLVYKDLESALYGTAANYWKDTPDGLVGYSALNRNPMGSWVHMLPFHNPLEVRHYRAFAAVTRRGEWVLHGEPVTLTVRLLGLTSSQNINLPLQGECIRHYDGQQPAQFSSPMAFANSWDRFSANGSWLLVAGETVYAIVTLDTQACVNGEEDVHALSHIWEIREGKVVDRHIQLWTHQRPINARLQAGKVSFLMAMDAEDGTLIGWR